MHFYLAGAILRRQDRHMGHRLHPVRALQPEEGVRRWQRGRHHSQSHEVKHFLGPATPIPTLTAHKDWNVVTHVSSFVQL